MIKYFEELENRKNYYLPLVKNDTEKLNVEINEFKEEVQNNPEKFMKNFLNF